MSLIHLNDIEELFKVSRNAQANKHFEIIEYDNFPSRDIVEFGPFQLNAFAIGIFEQGGKCEYIIDDYSYKIEENSAYFLAPCQIRSYKIQEWPKGFLILFTPTFIEEYGDLKMFESMPFFQPGKNAVVKLSDQYLELICTLIRQMKASGLEDRGLVYHYLSVIVLQAKLFFQSIGITTPHSDTNLVYLFNSKVHHYFEGLRTGQFDFMLTAKWVASEMYLHQHYLSDLLKAATGKTLSQHVRERIVLQAKSMLLNSSCQIDEVAYYLKFKDKSNFSSFFKAQTGQSPSQFRKNN